MTLVANSSQTRLSGQLFTLAFLVVVLSACTQEKTPVYLQGATMGTFYHITLSDQHSPARIREIETAVELILLQVNQSMSTYLPDSEISRFNHAPVGDWVGVSEGFLAVLEAAIVVWRDSEGAYDVSVAPLVNLWGFGPQRSDTVPTAAEIDSALANVGLGAIEIDRLNSRIRKIASRQLDFSSLAKGYGVDRVSSWLSAAGIENYLVEIGGEIEVSGKSPRDEDWRLAIERPTVEGGTPMAAIAINHGAVATSGDYRNFFESGGVRYSHSIDPATGYPVSHELVSVTVISQSAMLADAWATALVVLGPARALEIAARQGLACYLVVDSAGAMSVWKTREMDAYLQ